MKITNENNNTENIINIVQANSISSVRKIKSTDAGKNKMREKDHEIRSKTRKPFPIGIAFFVIIFTVFLMMCVSNYVALNENTREVSELKAELEVLKAEEKKLNAELDKKYDMVEIERYATEQLGMVNSSDVDKMYIEVSDDEKIEVYEVEEDGTIDAIATALFALAGNLADSWNTLMGIE